MQSFIRESLYLDASRTTSLTARVATFNRDLRVFGLWTGAFTYVLALISSP